MPTNRAAATKSTDATTTMTTTNDKLDMPNFDIRVADSRDHDRLLAFLRESYYVEEPLTIGSDPKKQETADEQFTMGNIEHGTCVLATTTEPQSGEHFIVAAVMAGPKDRHEAENLYEEAAAFGQQSKWGRILAILARIEHDANVFERFNVTSAVHAHALAVHQQFRGHALGARVMKELIAVGRKLNYQLLTADCTSLYSARLCERLAMQCVNRMRYDEYCDEEGNQVFKPPPPHVVIETYALRL